MSWHCVLKENALTFEMGVYVVYIITIIIIVIMSILFSSQGAVIDS